MPRKTVAVMLREAKAAARLRKAVAIMPPKAVTIMPRQTVPFDLFGRCRVCDGTATGVHYGVVSCDDCRTFYMRSLLREEDDRCYFGGKCDRRACCKGCRLRKCREQWTTVEAVQTDQTYNMGKETSLKQASSSHGDAASSMPRNGSHQNSFQQSQNGSHRDSSQHGQIGSHENSSQQSQNSSHENYSQQSQNGSHGHSSQQDQNGSHIYFSQQGHDSSFGGARTSVPLVVTGLNPGRPVSDITFIVARDGKPPIKNKIKFNKDARSFHWKGLHGEPSQLHHHHHTPHKKVNTECPANASAVNVEASGQESEDNSLQFGSGQELASGGGGQSQSCRNTECPVSASAINVEASAQESEENSLQFGSGQELASGGGGQSQSCSNTECPVSASAVNVEALAQESEENSLQFGSGQESASGGGGQSQSCRNVSQTSADERQPKDAADRSLDQRTIAFSPACDESNADRRYHQRGNEQALDGRKANSFLSHRDGVSDSNFGQFPSQVDGRKANRFASHRAGVSDNKNNYREKNGYESICKSYGQRFSPDDPAVKTEVKIEIDVAEDPSLFWGDKEAQLAYGSAKHSFTSETASAHVKQSSSSTAMFSSDSCVRLKQETDQNIDSCVRLKQAADQSSDIYVRQEAVDRTVVATNVCLDPEPKPHADCITVCLSEHKETPAEHKETPAEHKETPAEVLIQRDTLKPEQRHSMHVRQLCEAIFTNATALNSHMSNHFGQRHMLTHTGEKPHACHHCGKSFRTKVILALHAVLHAGQNALSSPAFEGSDDLKTQISDYSGQIHQACSQSTDTFTRPKSSKKPGLIHTGERPYLCHHCSANFRTKSNLNKHMVVHSEKRPYACSQCIAACKCSHALRKHMVINSGQKPFPCSQCTATFTLSASLQQHMLIHTGEKHHACHHCSAKFRSKGKRNQHMLIHSGQKPHTCSQCSETFNTRRSLKTHMFIHSGPKPFSCSQCCATFTESSSLKRHMLIHTGEKPYACHNCSLRFRSKDVLNQHTLIHLGLIPYPCSQCSAAFSKRRGLKRHMLTHSGQKPFSCSQCSTTFTQSASLKKHMLIHTGEKPHACHHCSARFRSKGYLNQHMLIHSGQKPHPC